MKTYELKEMLCNEVDDIVDRGTLGMGELDAIYKLTTSIKNIHKIEHMEAEGVGTVEVTNESMVDTLESMLKHQNLTMHEQNAIRRAMEAMKE